MAKVLVIVLNETKIPFAQLLYNLHEHLLPVSVTTRLVSLGQKEMNLVAVALIQLLNNVEGPLAQGLANRVKVNKDQVTNVAEPEYGVVDIERILHVTVNKSWRVYERDQVEVLLLGGCDLGVDIVQTAVNLSHY